MDPRSYLADPEGLGDELGLLADHAALLEKERQFDALSWALVHYGPRQPVNPPSRALVRKIWAERHVQMVLDGTFRRSR